MNFLYNIAIYITWQLLKITAIFNNKIQSFVAGRRGAFAELSEKIAINDNVIWVHCASLGEFEQGRPLIENIRSKYPTYKVVLTFFSPSGYEIQKNYSLANVITYLPIDTVSNAKKFLDLVNPKMAIFVKYEFWPNLLRELDRNNIDTILVSGIFRKQQVFFKWFGSWMRKSLKSFSYFFVQDVNSQELLNSIGIENVTESGDTRFDRVYSIKEQDIQLDFMTSFKQNKTLLVAGSTWKEDEEIIVDYLNTCKYADVKFVIAPHNINANEINKLKKSIDKKVILYSELEKGEVSEAEVFIVDTIGLLTKIYKYADIAYVGGAFETGLHNVLEPATFGIPIVIGPKYDKFNEAVELVKLKGCIPVKDYGEFQEILNTFLSDPKLRLEKGKIAEDYIANNTGATKMVFEYVHNKITN